MSLILDKDLLTPIPPPSRINVKIRKKSGYPGELLGTLYNRFRAQGGPSYEIQNLSIIHRHKYNKINHLME